MNSTDNFSKAQLEHYRQYEAVRQNGAYNMFDSRARAMTGLSGSEYSFVMEHYGELREAASVGDGNGKV